MIKKDKLGLHKNSLRVLNDSEVNYVVGGNGATPPAPATDACAQSHGCMVTAVNCPYSGGGSGIASNYCYPIEVE